MLWGQPGFCSNLDETVKYLNVLESQQNNYSSIVPHEGSFNIL